MRRVNLLFILPAVAILSCSKDEISTPEESEQRTIETTENSSLEANVEVAYPDDFGKLSEVYFTGQKITVEHLNGDLVFEGDILLTPDMVSSQDVKLIYDKGETPSTQKSVGRTSARWPDNKVYYSIDSNLDNKQRVTDAISHWEANTSLDFIQRSTESNYIYFTTGSGCASFIGMIGGKQNITLSSGCSTGSTIHEIGHAVGLWHEQSRVDRNNHISIHWNNIQSGREHNFSTYADSGFDGKEFTSTLDFGSIMMYGPYSFSSNGQPTITKANGSSYSIQRSGLSSGDIQGINSMYPSNTSVAPTYVNGEYYTINGLRVYRMYDRWYCYTRYGWKEVRQYLNYWFYA